MLAVVVHMKAAWHLDVVIILVLDQEGGANLDEALRGAMARKRGRAPIVETLLTKHSLGASATFTWVP